jgi:hypothetical protein
LLGNRVLNFQIDPLPSTITIKSIKIKLHFFLFFSFNFKFFEKDAENEANISRTYFLDFFSQNVLKK